MGKNIITYIRKKEKHMLVKEKPVLKNLDEFLAYAEHKKGELDRCGNGSRYTPQDASGTATEILRAAESAGCYDGSATPVVQIVNAFGIDLRRTSNMLEGMSGVIYAGGRTRDAYGSDAVIFTDSTEPYGHQRFVAAHELGHYLFDYIGNPGCLDNSRTFAENYPRKDHSSEKESRADRFAASLLMPAEKFRERYNAAMNYGGGSRVYTIKYLARYFQVKESSVEKRIYEVLYDGGY